LERNMLKKLVENLHSTKIEGLAGSFRRAGRIGFWSQLVLGAFPVLLMLFVFTFSGGFGTRAGLPIVGWLTLANMLVLLFTIIWFSGYVRFGQRIADASTRPGEAAVVKRVWTGLLVSTIGVVISLVLMFAEVAHLLFYFLAAPQGGIPTLQTTPSSTTGSWVSAVDMASLLSLVMVLAAEFLATILGMWLLFRTTHSYHELESAGA
jgi:hypothetical protein